MINWKVRLLRPDSHKRVSGIPGVIQCKSTLLVHSMKQICLIRLIREGLQIAVFFYSELNLNYYNLVLASYCYKVKRYEIS